MYSTLKYVHRHRTDTILLGNVKVFLQLKTEIIRMLHSMSYIVKFLEINTLEFGIPQSRPRT